MSLKNLFVRRRCKISPDVATATQGVYDAVITAREVIRKLSDADEQYIAEHIKSKRK